MMDKTVHLIVLLFATLSGDMESYGLLNSTMMEQTRAPALHSTNASADKMTSVLNFLVQRARETVMMTLNVKDHLFVDT